MEHVGVISVETLETARLRCKRRLAAVLVRALADWGGSFETIDMRVGWDHAGSHGGAEEFLHRLIRGEVNSLDRVSDFLFALGAELQFGITPLPPEHDTHPTPNPGDRHVG